MTPLYWFKWFCGIIEIGGHPIPKGAGNGQCGFRPGNGDPGNFPPFIPGPDWYMKEDEKCQ